MASATTVKEWIELQTMLFRTSAIWAVSESICSPMPALT